MLEVESPPDAGLTVQLVDSATGHVIATTSTSQVGTPAATGRMQVAPGRYIVRVGTSGDAYDRSTLRGPYRLWFYRFGYGPEAVSDTFAIGDTISAETIDPPGDIDVFHFRGVRGQHVNIALQGLAAPSGGGFQAFIAGPTGYSIVFSGTSAAALGDHQTLRVDLPATGWYEIDVSGAGWAGVRAERGAYRLAVEPLGAAPEHVSSALVPGDSVTTEAIDTPGDWDEYTVTASPGQEIGVIVHSTRTDFLYPYLRIFDRVTGDSLVTALYGDHFAGPFRVPASGEVGIAVYQPDGFFRFCSDATCGGYFRFVGGYAFRVSSINRAPESVPAAYAVGDAVRGEAVFPGGDIDELTSTAVPGNTLTAYIRLTAPPVGGDQFHGLTLEVIDTATGNALTGSLAQFFDQTFNPVGSFAVPAGGASSSACGGAVRLATSSPPRPTSSSSVAAPERDRRQGNSRPATSVRRHRVPRPELPLDLARDMHRAELRPAHRAKFRALEVLGGERLIVQLARPVGIERQPKLLVPVERIARTR